MLRSAWLLTVGAVLTVWYASKVYLLSYFGTKEAVLRSCHPAAQSWARAILRLAGVRVLVEGVENLDPDGAMIIVSNHESWFDVWALAGWLPIVPVAVIGTRPLMPKGSFRIGRGDILVRVGEPIDVTGMEHADRDRLTQMARDAVVELRGGEGRTSSLPGEEPVKAILESPGSSLNRYAGLEGLRPLEEERIERVSDH